jgi:hypothetical protein
MALVGRRRDKTDRPDVVGVEILLDQDFLRRVGSYLPYNERYHAMGRSDETGVSD